MSNELTAREILALAGEGVPMSEWWRAEEIKRKMAEKPPQEKARRQRDALLEWAGRAMAALEALSDDGRAARFVIEMLEGELDEIRGMTC